MSFLDDDYLLTTDVANELFHNHALSLPVVDYHCHLHPKEIYEDPNFGDIVEAWLTDGKNYGDHYKWRLMRANGVPERLITGDGDPWEKFQAYASTMERAVGSPVYLWTHMELRRYFGITTLLNSHTARNIYEEVNTKLATSDFSRRSLLRRMHVDTICTTDAPEDSLEYHTKLAAEHESFRMIPAFRPDKAINPDKPTFGPWVETMEDVCGVRIASFEDLVASLARRIDFFHDRGCRLCDHALGIVEYVEASNAELDAIFDKARAGREITHEEYAQFRTALLLQLMRLYQAKGWTMQIHIHSLLNINTQGSQTHGPDTGFDAMNDRPIAESLGKLLNAAALTDSLPKLLIYSLNPNDYMTIATVMGCFEGGMRQRIALGNAWWFNDTRDGIRRQLQVMAETSLLGNAVGMTTDSRSFLSFSRHEFFRRILCELLGEWVERGEIPSDPDFLNPLVEDISFNNAKALFK